VTGGEEKIFVSEIYNLQLNSDSLQDSRNASHENISFNKKSELTAHEPI
jgi:hypothetical protein